VARCMHASIARRRVQIHRSIRLGPYAWEHEWSAKASSWKEHSLLFALPTAHFFSTVLREHSFCISLPTPIHHHRPMPGTREHQLLIPPAASSTTSSTLRPSSPPLHLSLHRLLHCNCSFVRPPARYRLSYVLAHSHCRSQTARPPQSAHSHTLPGLAEQSLDDSSLASKQDDLPDPASDPDLRNTHYPAGCAELVSRRGMAPVCGML
jgi:hypothetical protein